MWMWLCVISLISCFQLLIVFNSWDIWASHPRGSPIFWGSEVNNIPGVCVPRDNRGTKQIHRTTKPTRSPCANNTHWHLFEYSPKYEPNSCVVYLHFCRENITGGVWGIYTSNISFLITCALSLLPRSSPICSYLRFHPISNPFSTVCTRVPEDKFIFII